MSKKNFVAKNSSKVVSKGQKSTKAKQPVIDQLVESAIDSQLAAAQEEDKSLQQAGQMPVDLAEQTPKQDKDKEVAEVDGAEAALDRVLSDVQPLDRGGESLLMEASSEERKDRAAAKIDDKDGGGWSSSFPLLAGLGALAALGGGGGGGGTSTALPPGFQGVVFDTPVTNAIVFRDSNGNGMWDANESIAVTDSNGNYSGLSGTGSVVATSLDRLVGRDAQGNIKHYTHTDQLTIQGRVVTGFAVDVGTDARLNTADDFVWSGTYVIGAGMQGDGSARVYITAVSSLVTAYLVEKGITSPSQDQLNTAIAELKTLFVFDKNSGVTGAGANVQFLTSELNGQVTKIMGDAIARAETAGTSVQEAIKAAVTALAKAAKVTTSADPIDLTTVADLQSIIFPNAEDSLIKAEALALQTSTTGPAVYSVWFDEDGTHVTRLDDELSTHGYDSKTATGDFAADPRPVGNITVLANENDSDVELNDDALAPNANVNFQAARLLVRAAGDGSTADMNVLDGRGEVTSVNVQATGGIGYTNEVQRINLAPLQGTSFVVGNEINLDLDPLSAQGLLEYTVTPADVNFPQELVTKVLAAYQQQITQRGLGVKLERNGGVLSIVWADEEPKAQAELIVNPETFRAVDNIVGGTAIYTDADLDLSLNGKITDGIDVVASNTSTDATAHIEGNLSVAGNMSVTASGTNSDALAILNGGDSGATVLGSGGVGDDLSVTASGDNADANATLNHASGRLDQVTVTSTGDDSYASTDVTVEADKTLTVQSVTLVANSAQTEGSEADADAYFRGETGELGDQRSWETLNDIATDHGKLVIAGDISVTAVGTGDWAYLGVNEEDEDQGYTVLGGGDIKITAQGENASADVHMRNVEGAAGNIDVAATGTSAVHGFNFLSFFNPDPRNVAGIRLITGDRIKFSVGDDFVQYTVTAQEVRNAVSINALLESVVTSFNQQALAKDLGVSFSSTNTGPYSNADKGLFATWDSIRSETPATIELTRGVTTTNITAKPDDINYSRDDYFVFNDGTVDSEARLSIQTEHDGLNAAAVTVTAEAENAYADADILGDAGISGEITVTASEIDAEALLHVNDQGEGTTTLSGQRDVTITASAEDTDAHAILGNAKGAAGDITVAASAFSADASLTAGNASALSADSLTVTAAANSADAMAELGGGIGIRGDISVTAEGTSAEAAAYVNVEGEDDGSSTLGKTVSGVHIGSNIHVDAVGTEASATVGILNAQGTVGSVDVTATGNSADAVAAILGDYTVQGDITVTANQTEAYALVGIPYGPYSLPDSGTVTFEDSDITVTATGQSSEAFGILVNAAGAVDDISVTASTSLDANAGVWLGTEESKQLDIHNVTLLSSSNLSNATVVLGGNVHISGDVDLTSSALSAETSADFNGVITVDGNMDVHATNEDSRADLTINQIVNIDQDEDLDQSQSSVLAGGDIHLQASGEDSSANATIHQASGTLGAVRVDGTGDDAQAYLEVGAQADQTLRVASISLNADSTAVGGTDAWADAYFRGETGKVSNQNRWTDLNTISTDHGTVQVDGDIHVNAEGSGDWAYLGLNDGGPEDLNNDRGYTVLNQSGSQANITIRAKGTDASAEAYINNAAGTAGDITVEATGTHEVQGFDFLYYFRPELGAALLWKDEFSITVDGETYTYEVGSNETRKAEGINALLNKIVADFNAKAAGDGITFSTDFSGPSPFAKGLFVTWDTVRDESARISVAHKSGLTTTDITNEAGEAQYFFVKDGTVNSDAYLDLKTEYTGVTARSLTVTADAEDSDAASDILGDVEIQGDITITAAELDAEAYADINGEGNGLTKLGGVNASALEVHATVDGADASLVIGNASGLATSVDVRATADDTTAYLSLQALEEDGNTLSLAGDLNVIANGVDASADAHITTTGAALGTVTVTADDTRADADLNLSASANISASSVTVTATGASADASADLDADSVAVRGDLRVTSSGIDADAYASIGEASVLGTANARSGLEVDAKGERSDAVLNISNASGKVAGITVAATGVSATASLSLDDDSSAALKLDIVGELDVTANGTDADAQATISATSAQQDYIEVSALGTSASTDLSLDIEEALTAGQLTVTASGDDSYAEGDITGGDATITGDISVTANGEDSVAAAHINEDRGTTALTGGNDLAVSATGEDSKADLHIHNASGSLDAVNVSANSNGAYSTLNVFVEAGETLSVNTVTLTADSSGAGSDADATFGSVAANATVEIKGDIHLDATSASDWAYLGVNDGVNDKGQTVLGGGNLTLHAEGEDAIAEAYIYNASGSVADIALDASNVLAESSLDLIITGELTANSLTIEASDAQAEAHARVQGNVSILGDVDVTASGVDAAANVGINGEDSGTTTFGQTISGDVVGSAIDVTASGNSSMAGAVIRNALGTVDTLTVTASGGSVLDDRSYACADVAGDFVVQSDITVTASGSEAWAMAAVNGMCADTDTSVTMEGGDISVTASGDEALAVAFVNNVNGSAGDIGVTANDTSADALLWLNTDAEALDIENLNVLSSAQDTEAAALVSGDVHVTGDITVTASGMNATAGAGINAPVDFAPFSVSPVSIETQLGDATGGSNITVQASGVGSSADANMGSVFGSADAIRVTANNNSADADLNIVTSSDGLTVNTLNVTASSLDASADADIDGEVRFTGDISVLASGTSANASSHMTGSVDVDGNIGVNASGLSADAELAVDGTFTMSGDISANASGNSAEVTVQLSDEVDLLGNFSLEASGTCADANANLSDSVTITGDIHVTASGLSSDAVANLSNVVDLTGDLNVTAGGVDSESTANLSGNITIVGDINNNASGDDAYALVEMVGSMDITGDINVTATGNDYSEALTWLNGTVVMSGDVNVAAKDEDDYATASMRNDVTLTGDINVSADGVDSNAYVDMHGDVTITGNLEATASAYDAYTDVTMQGKVNFTGDMHFSATAEDAMTSADINGGVEDSTSVLDVGTLRLDSSGEDAVTKALIDNASGTVDLVSVNATGDDSYSDLEVAVEVENTLNVETINVRANSDMSATGDSSVADAYLYGKTGDIPEQDRWKLLDSESTDHGTVKINGDITVTAAGYNDSAYLGVNDSGPEGDTSDDGYTVLNGGNITLAAVGTDSDTETYIHNANGTLADVSVTAGGNSEVQGFDFLHYFRPSGGRDLQANDVFSFTVEGHTLTYKVKLEEIGNTEKINALLESVVQSFNAQAQQLHLGLQFTSSYIETDRETSRLVPFEKGLFATWDSVRNEAAAVIALDTARTPLVGAVTISADTVDSNGASYFHTDHGNESSSAYFELKTENGGVTMETLTVIASAKNSASEANVSGDVAITGDITVSATEIDADASLDISGYSTDTVLGHVAAGTAVGSNITVEATNTDSDAQAAIEHVSGFVADLTVEATGDDSSADLYMDIEADETLTLETITVNANSTASGGSSAEANAYLRGENGTIAEQDRWTELNNNSTDHGTVAIEGEITVTAGGTDDLAYLGVNDTGPDSTNDDRGYTVLGKEGTGADLTVQATGTGASAEAYIYNATGTVADITVEASGSHEVQGFDLLYFFRPNDGEIRLRAGNQITYTVGDETLSYTVTADDARNVAGINTMLENIVVQFNAQAEAADLGVTFKSTHLDPLSPFEKGLFATWDTIRDEEAAVIRYVASGNTTLITGDVDYEDYFYTRHGTVDSDAYLDLRTEFGGVTADSLTVTASAENAQANVDIAGDVDILGDIAVTASELSADAFGYINGEDEGSTTLGEMVNGQVVGSAISVTASNTTTFAGAIIHNVLGTVDTLTVTASGGSANGGDDILDRSFACADVAGDFVIQSDITVTASGADAWAMAGVNAMCADTTTSATMEGGDITVTASGDESLAATLINNVNGLADDVTVTASGESADAMLWISTDAELELDNLSVLSSSEQTQAVAMVSGDVHITGDISVTASDLRSMASTDINGDGEFIFVPFSLNAPVIDTHLGDASGGSNISVVSSGQAAKASAVIGSGSGVAGDVSVRATGPMLAAAVYERQIYTLEDIRAKLPNGAPDILTGVSWTIKGEGFELGIPALADFGTQAFFDNLNAAAQFLGLNITFSQHLNAQNQQDGLVVEWTEYGDYAPVSFQIQDENSTYWNTSGLQPSVGSVNGTESDSVNSEADLDMHLDGTIAGDLLVEATNVLTSADAVINGELTLQGDITITASGMSADAVADINREGSEITTLAVGDITVTASAEDAFADLNIDNAKGQTGHITLSATSEDAGAYVDVWVADNQNLTIASMSLDASSHDATAELDVDGLRANAVVTVTGDIYLQSAGLVTDVDVNLMDQSNRQGRVVLGGGDITLRNLADAAETHVHILNASGSVGEISLLNTGMDTDEDESYTHVELEAGPGRDLTIESLTLVNQSGEGSRVNVDLWTASADAEISITGDILVTANGEYTDAEIELNDESTWSDVAFADTMNTGTITLGTSVNGQVVGSNISVVASGDASTADASMYNIAGHAGDISVKATGDMVGDNYTVIDLATVNNIFFGENNNSSVQNALTWIIDGERFEALNPADFADVFAFYDHVDSLLSPFGYSVGSFGAEPPEEKFKIYWPSGDSHGTIAFDNGQRVIGKDELLEVSNWDYEERSNGESANAFAEMELDGTVNGDILVEASGKVADADFEAGGAITVKGDVTVLASGQNAYADLDFNDDDADYEYLGEDNIDFNDNAITTMAAGNYRVAATGTSAYAESELENAMGTVAALSVEATGDSSEADFEGEVEADKTLTVGTVTVLANSYGKDTAYAEAYLKGETGIDAAQTPWEDLTEDDIDHGTVAITGNITVSALGAEDEAYLEVNVQSWGGEDIWSRDDGYTLLGGGDITVKAAGTESLADALIANARGTAGDITVNAQGAAEVQGFDFLYFFRPAGGEMTINRDMTFSTTVAGEVFSYDITTADFPRNDTVPRVTRINNLLNSIVESFNDQALEKGLDVRFSTNYDVPTYDDNRPEFDDGLFVTWLNKQDNQLVEIRLDDTLIADSTENDDGELIYKDYFFNQDGTVNNTANFELQTEIRGVTADSLTVTASAENGLATADIVGNVTIVGDITVSASELYADAKAHVNVTQTVTKVNLGAAFGLLYLANPNPSDDAKFELIFDGAAYVLDIGNVDPQDPLGSLNQMLEPSGIWLEFVDENYINVYWPIGNNNGSLEFRLDGTTIGMEQILDVDPLGYVQEEVRQGNIEADMIGDTVLGGGDITVTSSGSVSYAQAEVSDDTPGFASSAEAVIQNASGSIGSIKVSSTGAPLTRDVKGALDPVSEVQTISFDTFSSWNSSNDDVEGTSDTFWTLRVDGGVAGSEDDFVFEFEGNNWDQLGWDDLVQPQTEPTDRPFEFSVSGDELTITWDSDDVTDYDLAVMHGKGTITTGKDWVTQELVNEWETMSFDINSFSNGYTSGEDSTWVININGHEFVTSADSSSDTLLDIVNGWSAELEASEFSDDFDIIYHDDGTEGIANDWFEVRAKDNGDTEHSVDVIFSDDTGSLDVDAFKVQTFNEQDVTAIINAVENEDFDSTSTWTLTVGGEDYSVTVSGDWDTNARGLMFDVVQSWDTMVSSDGVDLRWDGEDWFEVVWADSADASLVTINITGNDGHTAKEIDVGVIAEFTTQDGVEMGINWVTPGGEEVQKFYFVKFSDWASYDTSSTADVTISSVSEDWSVSVSPYSNSKGASFTMSSDDLIDLVSNDDVTRLLGAWESATRSGNYDLSILTGEDDGGKYFTITMGDYDHPNEPSGASDEFSDHDPARFEVRRVITREATWSEDNLTLGEDFEMTDGFSSRTICEHEYIPTIARLDLEFNGAITGDVTVEATNLAAESYAMIDGDISISGDITLRATGDESIAELMINLNDDSNDIGFSNDIAVSVTGDDAQAALVLNGLVGEAKTLTVNVTGQDALATADLVFNQFGSVKTTSIHVDHRGEALVTLDQSMQNALVQDSGPVGLTPFNTGTVSVTGEGHVGLTYMLDSSAVKAKTIDLRGLNQEVVNGEVTQKTWGYADIDLVAKWVNGDAQGPQFTDTTTLFPKIMEVKGFNVDRDVINLSHVIDPSQPSPQDPVVSDYVFEQSQDVNDYYQVTMSGDTTLIRDLETSGAYFEAVQDLLSDATAYFRSQRALAVENFNFEGSEAKTLGYFYREVTFDFGRNGASVPEVRSFLVYDFDVLNSQVSGIITFGSTTGLTERNVSERYTLIQEDDSSDTVNTLDGYHNIDLFTAASVLDGDNSQSWDLGEDADVMINDIKVTAYETIEDEITFLTSGDVSVSISGDDDSSLQLRQSEILVAADRENSEASLTISDAWGTVSKLQLHGYLGGVVSADISNIDYMTIQDYLDAISDDDDEGNGNDLNPDAYVGHLDNGLYIRDVEITADGNLSNATLSLDVDGFVQTLTMQTLGFGSSIDVVIDQAEYGGEVFISGSNLTEEHASCDCIDEVGSNDITLAYVNGTAAKIVIDNAGREPLAGADAEDDDSISFTFLYTGDDKDLVQADAWAQRVTIEGWTQNDYLNLSDAAGTSSNFDHFQGNLLDLNDDGRNLLLTGAFIAFETEGVDYYFGQMGGNGYLFHDQDGDGLTMIVEFLGVTTFDYTQIIGTSNPT